MLQLRNESPFKAQLAVFPDAAGVDTLYVAVKATFRLAPRLAVADEQQPVALADEYAGEPGRSSLRLASEMHLAKPGTDVVLNGRAHAPGGKPVARLDVSLAVGDRRKVVRVFGDRRWRGRFLWVFPGGATPPKPFTTMPLVYERAFGGVHELGDRKNSVLFEARNPVGIGFAGKRRGGKLKGLPLPNLEDPAHLVRGPGDRPAPAGFGFIAPSWEPRRSYAGTYDEAWMKKRAPILPADFDPRFFHAAHPDLAFARHLAGGETVEVVNVSPRGTLRFRVPSCALKVEVRLAGVVREPPARLETVLVEPDEERLSLLWRAAVPCDKQALKVEEARVTLGKMALDGGAPRRRAARSCGRPA